jgi:basic amino acid/polyamine antiporter, APA family
MAAEAVGSETPTLFLRKATGLVRGWSVRDSMIYACLSTNVVTLGIFEFSYQSFFPKGQILTSVLVSAVWVSFLVIAYAGLIVTIPRAGGDYVWQTRILGSGVGFVVAITGWWFTLWLWAPIYGNVLSAEFFQPLLATLGHPSAATWFGGKNGIFLVSMITIAMAGLVVSLGMSSYAKLQKWGFYGGLLGFGIVLVLLAINNRTSFINSFNLEAQKIFGVHNAFQATNAGAAKAGYHSPAFGFSPISASMLLVPMMMFYLLWPNWGATLYGEIRGASDFRRVFSGMFGGLWITVILSVLFLVLINKTMGQAFYNNTGALYWEQYYGGKVPAAIPIWPYPVMFVGWLVHNQIFQVVLLVLMLLWFLAWVGTLFLSSTRVIFAAAFDRILPDRAAEVSEKRKVPMYSLLLMLAPAVVLSAVYAYWTTFQTYILDATLVIAVSFLFSSIAVVLLPFVKKDLWRASPASRIKLFGVPVVPAAGWITLGLLGFNLYEWLTNATYGVNNRDSLYYMAGTYVLALLIYVVARIVRNRQGIDLGLINKEIPVE